MFLSILADVSFLELVIEAILNFTIRNVILNFTIRNVRPILMRIVLFKFHVFAFSLRVSFAKNIMCDIT